MQHLLPAPVAANAGNRRIIAPARRLPVPVELIGQRVYLIRAQKVMLVNFPADFMFRLTNDEADSLRCPIGTSNETRGDRRYLPSAFTEHGVAILSSVLNSERAVQMNILIVRAFVKLREVLVTHKDLARKMERLEHTQKDHAAVLPIVVKDIQDFEKKVMRGLKNLRVPSRRKPRMGFITEQR